MKRMTAPMRAFEAPRWLSVLWSAAGPATAIIAFQVVVFPAPMGIVIRGMTIGLLTALIALGMALVYRSNRVLNFAQADLGYLPAVVAVMLVSVSGLNYFLGFAAGLLAAIVFGIVVELVIIRRFFTAPRLILTVATIGLAQLLSASALFASHWWEGTSASHRVVMPWDAKVTVAPLTFNSSYLAVWLATPVILFAIWWLLTRTMVGALIRAGAEQSERAALLGVPVRRLNSLVLGIAAALAFVALWLRAGVLGLPVGTALGLGVLLRAIGALVLGRMTRLPAVALSATALGVLETAVTFGADSADQGEAVVAGVILVALLLRRRSTTRADLDETSSWQTAAEVRRVPQELRRVPEVRAIVWTLGALLTAAALALPEALSTAQLIKASAVVAFAIVGTSIVVLTGWAGQVSLGQMAFTAWGGAVTAAATAKWDVDLLVALALSAASGTIVAVVVGLPALRNRGFYLAVTTLAFSLVTTTYLLDDSHFGWVSDDRFARHPLLGRIDIESPARMYYVTLAGLFLVVFLLRGVRTSRTGRVLLALRENQLAAQAYGVDPTRVMLTGFALSGAIAAFAGGLLAYQQHAFSLALHSPTESINVFVSTVIGGLGSLAGGLIGATFSKGLGWFLPSEWAVLSTSLGMLLVLLLVPGGIGGGMFALRDRWLRSVARRRGMVVPSLLADKAEPSAAAPVIDSGAIADEPGEVAP